MYLILMQFGKQYLAITCIANVLLSWKKLLWLSYAREVMEQGSSKYQHHNTGYVVKDRGDAKNEDGKPKTPKKEK